MGWDCVSFDSKRYNNILTHMIHPSIRDLVVKKTETTFDASITSELKEEVLHLNPGGLIDIITDPIETEFDGLKVMIRPEHIIWVVRCFSFYCRG